MVSEVRGHYPTCYRSFYSLFLLFSTFSFFHNLKTKNKIFRIFFISRIKFRMFFILKSVQTNKTARGFFFFPDQFLNCERDRGKERRKICYCEKIKMNRLEVCCCFLSIGVVYMLPAKWIRQAEWIKLANKLFIHSV